MNLKELAWAAGFYDGEGSTCGGVRPDRARGTRLMMSITQTDPRVLKRFKAAVGVGQVNGPYDFKGNRHRQAPQWAWQCQNWRDVQVAVAKLWRFLGPVKREQIQRAVAASRSREWGLPVGHPKAVSA